MNQINNNIVREDSRYDFRNSQPGYKKGLYKIMNLPERMDPNCKTFIKGVVSSVSTTDQKIQNKEIAMKRINNTIVRNNLSSYHNSDRAFDKNVNVTRIIASELNGKLNNNKNVDHLLHSGKKIMEEENTRKQKIIDQQYTGLERSLVSGALIKQQLNNNFEIINNPVSVRDSLASTTPYVSADVNKNLLDVVKNKYGVDIGKIISNTRGK